MAKSKYVCFGYVTRFSEILLAAGAAVAFADAVAFDLLSLVSLQRPFGHFANDRNQPASTVTW